MVCRPAYGDKAGAAHAHGAKAFGQGRHILAIAGAAAGFACIWAVTPVRREPQKKPN